MDFEYVDIRNSGVEDEWGVYGIAGVSQLSKGMVEYFNYEGSARGSYDNHGHVGLLARMHQHLDKLEFTHDEIVASRASGVGEPVQYIHELCSRAKTQFQMYKLASFPIVVNAGVLQMQMKQMAIFMEQVYLIYFGNYSGTPHTQAISNLLRPEEMPLVQGIGANRQLPLFERMLAGGVDMISSSVLYSLVRSYFKVHGATELNKSTFADLFSQYKESGNGHYTRGPLDYQFKRQVHRLWRREFKARGLIWSTPSELVLKRYWPVLYSIKMALGPFLQGPVGGIYQRNPHRLNWHQIVETAKANPSAVGLHIFTVGKCRSWWGSILFRYGDLVFCAKVWDNITGKPQTQFGECKQLRDSS